MCKPISKKTTELKPEAAKALSDSAEAKRVFINKILEECGFWGKTLTAFKDCTISGRVLLNMVAGPDSKTIRFQYFTLPEFTYQHLLNDAYNFQRVSIVYQDERTLGLMANAQVWHRWVYEMKSGFCWVTHDLVTGNNQPIENPITVQVTDDRGVAQDVTIEPLKPKERYWNSGLTQLPCYVIINGGLTGDTKGVSEIKGIMSMANNYNRTVSDFRDAIRFRMFDQMVIINGDSDAIGKMKIAPGAVIDLKQDSTTTNAFGGGQSAPVSATMLASTFNFAAPVDSYLDRLIKNMYEAFDMPTPEQIKDIPSAKAMRFLFYDQIARCEERWTTTWNGVLKWVLSILMEAVQLYKLYPEWNGVATVQIPTVDSWAHNYPIPEDDETKRNLAMAEVTANVRSHKTYLKEFGNVEDEGIEWSEILEEAGELNEQTNAGFMQTAEAGATGEEGATGAEAAKPKEGEGNG